MTDLLLQQQHEVIGVRHQGGEWTVDMTDADSIAQLFARVGHFDALVVASGAVAFNSLSAMSTAEWQVGLNSKLLGQIHLTQAALPWLNEGGRFNHADQRHFKLGADCRWDQCECGQWCGGAFCSGGRL